MAPIPVAAKVVLGPRGTAQSAVSKTAVAKKAARWSATSGVGLVLANLDATPPGNISGNTNMFSSSRTTRDAPVAPRNRAMFIRVSLSA
jgi:hypothetical protein